MSSPCLHKLCDALMIVMILFLLILYNVILVHKAGHILCLVNPTQWIHPYNFSIYRCIAVLYSDDTFRPLSSFKGHQRPL